MLKGKRVALVLGGGGIKGLAHVGVLKALKAFGIQVDEYIGTSVGSLMCALSASGLTPEDLQGMADELKREDIVDPNWLGVLWKRREARSLLRGNAFSDYVQRKIPVTRWDDLKKPLYVTSVNLTRGEEVIWGMPGFTEVPVPDAVLSSCSIPGIFPPKRIHNYFFVDGSLIDPLPIKVAVYNKVDLIIGVYLETLGEQPLAPPPTGIAAVLMQSQTILSRTLIKHDIRHFEKAPLVLIHPKVSQYTMFDFEHLPAMIQEGERAAYHVLSTHELLKDWVHPPDVTPTRILDRKNLAEEA